MGRTIFPAGLGWAGRCRGPKVAATPGGLREGGGGWPLRVGERRGHDQDAFP